MVFFSGRNCLADSIFYALRSGCSVFSEQILFEGSPPSLVRYAERNKLRLVIGSFDVFNPVVKEIKKAIENERIFEAFFSRVGPKQFGYVRLNIVDDLVIQDIGIISYLFGQASLVAAHSRDTYNHCFVHLKSGETSIFAYANKDPYYKERTIELFGEKTKLHANMLSQRLTLMRSSGIIQSLYGTGYESYKEHLIKKSEPLKEAVGLFAKGKKNPVDYGTLESNLALSWEIKKAIQPPVRGVLGIPSGN
jgi:predicted dehydrogenase